MKPSLTIDMASDNLFCLINGNVIDNFKVALEMLPPENIVINKSKSLAIKSYIANDLHCKIDVYREDGEIRFNIFPKFKYFYLFTDEEKAVVNQRLKVLENVFIETFPLTEFISNNKYINPYMGTPCGLVANDFTAFLSEYSKIILGLDSLYEMKYRLMVMVMSVFR